MSRIKTRWAKRTYDVWGNKKDGYEVNDSFSCGEVEIACKVNTWNKGTKNEFVTCYPSDYALQQIFGTRANIETTGDDIHVYVLRASDSYPLGELHCVSHESLSPIKEKQERE